MYFNCEPYSSAELAIALSNSYTTPLEISRKSHFEYLLGYLGNTGLKAKTIVIENDYVSLDYLTDYAEYYAQCFQKYPKTCKRVHFFSNEFDPTRFTEVIAGNPNSKDNRKFWKHYLGNIVVRPIPQRVIGTTLLRTYPEFEKIGAVHRHFFGGRDYKIHLFGNEISIRSLAFQEQDRVLSACATAAVWSMLHKASSHHYAVLKTPSEITKDANANGIHGERLFPNDGLTTLQITTAIQKAGMETEVRSSQQPDFTNSYVKRVIRAYATIGVPILMGIQVPVNKYNGLDSVTLDLQDFKPKSNSVRRSKKDVISKEGSHATAICGYRYKKFNSKKPTSEITWRSDAIEKLLVHDDQWGPFARMVFVSDTPTAALMTDWSNLTRKETPITDLIIPLYHKIRIKLDEVEFLITAFDRIFWNIFEKGATLKEDISWDVYLDYSENFKQKVKSYLQGHHLHRILQRSLPKYLWIANCFVGNSKVMTIVFDATDLSINMYGLLIVFQDLKFKQRLNGALRNAPQFSKFIAHPAAERFFQFLLNESNPSYIKI